jgi:c-di-GMP-binding flagellar brake protein YcgR
MAEEERPRERRVLVKDPVSFEGKKGVGRGTAFNLSLNGCAFESGAPFDPDATMQMNLHIPTDKKPVKVGRARVTWKAGNDVGVEFLNVESTGKVRLKRYIENLQQNSSKKTRA